MRTYRRHERVIEDPPQRSNDLPAVSGEIIVPDWPEGTDVTAIPKPPAPKRQG